MNASLYHRITEIIAALFILLFVYTALSKLTNFTAFQSTLRNSPLAGSYASLISRALPVTELIIAGLLFFPRSRAVGLYSSLVIMIIFTLYVGGMILYASRLPCSCDGVLKQMSWKQHVIFNSGFTILAGTGILTYRKSKILLQQ